MNEGDLISSKDNDETDESKEIAQNPIKISDITSKISKISSLFEQSSLDLVSNLGVDLSSIYTSVPSSLSSIQAAFNKEQTTKHQSLKPSSDNEKTDLIINPKDLFYISKKQKKILLFEFFDINKKEEINHYFRLLSDKEFVSIDTTKSKEVVQRSINRLPLNIELSKHVSSVCVHSGYFFGHHFTLIFECLLSTMDINENPSKYGYEVIKERFEVFEDIHAEIENSLPDLFHGFFFKNELGIRDNKRKLPSIYVYDVKDYNLIFEDNMEEQRETSRFQIKSVFDTPTLKAKAYNFFMKDSSIREKAIGYDPLLFLGIMPNVLFAQISDKLICSQSDVYFDNSLGSIPSNFVVLEFNEGQLTNFVLEFVEFYYLYIILEKKLIDLFNIEIPETVYFRREILDAKKAEISRIKSYLTKISKDIFLYSQIINSLDITNLEFNQEETRFFILPVGKSVDNDSISQFFIDRIIKNKRKLEEKIDYLQERVSEVEVSIINELKIGKNKPKINSLFNTIESDLIQQIRKWDGTEISHEKIEAWLLNFKRNEDRKIALKLLNKLIYISYSDLRILLKSAYGSLLCSLQADDLTNCYISNIGDPTSGSMHLLKIFQEENGINSNIVISFENLKSLTGNIDKTVIFIDDFIGTGDTYIDWYEKNTDVLNCFSKVIYVSATGLQKGITRIETETKTEVLCVNIFDEDEQVIDGTLFNFEDKKMVTELIDKYSSTVGFQNMYGYGKCQLLLAFEYNIPNSSIGILWWSKNNWTPLLKRK